jgi:hypothetical protein
MFLDNDNTLLKHQKIVGTGALQGTYAHFGFSVANIGDLDLDGIPDLAVGQATSGGVVWILLLNKDGTVREQAAISISDSVLAGADLRGGDLFGGSITGLADANADGVIELAVGSRSSGDGNEGAVHILFLSPLPCRPGMHVNENRLSPEVCLECAAGTYQPFSDQPRCFDCQPGTFQSLVGQSDCTTCTPGTLCLDARATQALPCPNGARCLSPQVPELIILPGTLFFSDSRAVEVLETDVVNETWSYTMSLTGPPKKEADASGFIVVQVSMDLHSPIECAKQNERCNLPTTTLTFTNKNYTEPQTITVKVPRRPEYEGPLTTRFEHTIVASDADVAWDLVRLSVVTLTLVDNDSCPINAVQAFLEVDAQIRTCQCLQDYYVEDASDDFCGSALTCRQCLDGMNCDWPETTLGLSDILLLPGYYRTDADSLAVVECPVSAACGGEETHGEGLCTQGYSGALCQVCDKSKTSIGNNSYAWIDGQCKACSTGDQIVFASAFAVVLLMLILIAACLACATRTLKSSDECDLEGLPQIEVKAVAISEVNDQGSAEPEHRRQTTPSKRTLSKRKRKALETMTNKKMCVHLFCLASMSAF